MTHDDDDAEFGDLDPLRWPLSPTLHAKVRAGLADGCDPAAPEAPLVAYILGLRGDRWRAKALSAALLARPLLDQADCVDTANLTIHRLWLARAERRTDADALDAARALLTETTGLDVERRALLHHAYGAAILEAPATSAAPAAQQVSSLEEAGSHFQSALVLAQATGFRQLEAATLTRLAVLELPRGHLAISERLSSQALALFPIDPEAARPRRWQLRALLVQQWSRHYQGLPLDPAAMALCSQAHAAMVDPTVLAIRGALSGFAALEAGSVPVARMLVDEASADRRLPDLGIWRLPLLMLDGYLAVWSDDTAKVETVIHELTQIPSPAEALMLRAVQLSHHGRFSEAATAIGPVTTGAVRTFAITYPAACALSAVLHERLGDPARAEADMRQALGSSAPMNARHLFAMHDAEATVTVLERMQHAPAMHEWASAALGHVRSHAHSHYVARRVRECASGGAGAPPGPAGRSAAMASPLTARERDVLALVQDGISQGDMARELFVSLNTIKTHLRSIRHKLGVERTGEAVAVARGAGWLS